MVSKPNIINNWRIGIFGTDIDQKYLKNILNLQIFKNIDFINFTKINEFGIDTETHPHQTCINAVSTCNIAFFFINRRYGGKYRGNIFWRKQKDDWTFPLSITHAEYRKAKKEKIPTVVFVNSKIDQEYFELFLKDRENDESDFERYEKIKNKWKKEIFYAKNPEVFCFIREVTRGLGENQNYQSWYVNFDEKSFFANNCELGKTRIIDVLKSLTPVILRDLAQKQYESIKNEFQIGPIVNYDFLKDNKCLIKRSIQSEKGRIIKNPHKIIQKSPNHIIITGDANIGKTFFLIDSFRDDVKTSKKILDRSIPIYFRFKNRDKSVRDLESLIAHELKTNLSLSKFPFNFNNVSITLYIDGIDEGEYLNCEDLQIFFTNVLHSAKNLKLILSLRQDFFDLNYTVFNNIFKGKLKIYRLKKIDIEEGKELINNIRTVLEPTNIFQKKKLPNIFPDSLLQEPMHCVMAAYIYQKIPLDEKLNIQLLYEQYIALLAEHEVNRLNRSLILNKILDFWRDLALIYAQNKTMGIKTNCHDLSNELIKKKWDIINLKRTFSSLIECNRQRVYFKCDSILNSMISTMYISYLLRENEGENDILTIDCYFDTSVFLREQFNDYDSKQIKIIKKRLNSTIKKYHFRPKDADVRRTANCIFLLGLLGRVDPKSYDIKNGLNVLLRRLKKGSFSYVGALFALTSLKEFPAEKKLFKILKKENIRKQNLDFHLSYFGAIAPQKTFPPNITIPEEGIDCSRLLNGILNRFNKKTDADLFRVRINVCMMCDALEFYHNLYSNDDAKKWVLKIDDCINEFHSDNKKYNKMIDDAIDRLRICKNRIGFDE